MLAFIWCLKHENWSIFHAVIGVYVRKKMFKTAIMHKWRASWNLSNTFGLNLTRNVSRYGKNWWGIIFSPCHELHVGENRTSLRASVTEILRVETSGGVWFFGRGVIFWEGCDFLGGVWWIGRLDGCDWMVGCDRMEGCCRGYPCVEPSWTPGRLSASDGLYKGRQWVC